MQKPKNSENLKNFQKISEIFQKIRKFSENFRNFQKMAENFRLVPDLCRTCPGPVPDLFRTCPDLSRTCPGPVPDLSRTCPGPVPELCRTMSLRIFWNFRNFLKIFEIFWNFLKFSEIFEIFWNFLKFSEIFEIFWVFWIIRFLHFSVAFRKFVFILAPRNGVPGHLAKIWFWAVGVPCVAFIPLIDGNHFLFKFFQHDFDLGANPWNHLWNIVYVPQWHLKWQVWSVKIGHALCTALQPTNQNDVLFHIMNHDTVCQSL